MRGSPSAATLPGRGVGRPRRAAEAGRGQEGQGRAELGRRRLRRGAPARTSPHPPTPSPPLPRPARGGERESGARPGTATPTPSGEARDAGRSPPPAPGARYLAAALGVPGLRPRHARLQLLEAPTPAAQSGPAAMSSAPRDALWGEGGRESLEGGRRCRAGVGRTDGRLCLARPGSARPRPPGELPLCPPSHLPRRSGPASPKRHSRKRGRRNKQLRFFLNPTTQPP